MNCTNFTTDDILRAAVARGVTGGVCMLLTILILFIVVIVRAFQIFLERLFVYLTAITVWALAMETIFVSWPYTGLSQSCAIGGFLTQWSASCVLIFAFVVSLIILCKVLGMCNGNPTDGTKKLLKCSEAAFVLFLIVLPLPFIWIPFVNENYAADVEPWCWIEIHNEDCSENVAGFWEQIGLFYAPLGVLGLLILLFILLTLCVFCKGFCLAQIDLHLDLRRRQGIKAAETVILLVFLLLFGTFAGLEALSSLYFGFTKKPQDYPLLIVHAISSPLYKLLLPVGFMFQLHSLKKFKLEEVKTAIRKWKQLFAFCCKKFRDNQPTPYTMIDRSNTYITAKSHVNGDSSSRYTSFSANAAINDPSSSSYAIYITPDNSALTEHAPPAEDYGSCNLPVRVSITPRKGHYCLVC